MLHSRPGHPDHPDYRYRKNCSIVITMLLESKLGETTCQSSNVCHTCDFNHMSEHVIFKSRENTHENI